MIIKNIKDKRQLEEIKNMILHLFNNLLEMATQEELIEKIEIKIEKEENDMSSLYDRLLKEIRSDIRRGKKEAKRETAEELIKNKVEDKIILKSTKITKEELENLKQKILVKK